MMAARDNLRAFLGRYVRHKERVVLLTNELNALTGAVNTVTTVHGCEQRVTDMDVAVAKATQRLSKEIQQSADYCDAIMALISQVEDVNVRGVLEYHYLGGDKLEIVAKEMSYSLSTVKRLHKRGLEELEKYYYEMEAQRDGA